MVPPLASDWFLDMLRNAPSLEELELAPFCCYEPDSPTPLPTGIEELLDKESAVHLQSLRELTIDCEARANKNGRMIMPTWNPLCEAESLRIFPLFSRLTALTTVTLRVGQLTNPMLVSLSRSLSQSSQLRNISIELAFDENGESKKAWQGSSALSAEEVFSLLPSLTEYPLPVRHLSVRFAPKRRIKDYEKQAQALVDSLTAIGPSIPEALDCFTIQYSSHFRFIQPIVWTFVRWSVDGAWRLEESLSHHGVREGPYSWF